MASESQAIWSDRVTFTLRFLQVLHPVRDLVCFWIEERGVFLGPAVFGDLDDTRVDDTCETLEEGVSDMSYTTPEPCVVYEHVMSTRQEVSDDECRVAMRNNVLRLQV
jgi:hypothetical protein